MAMQSVTKNQASTSTIARSGANAEQNKSRDDNGWRQHTRTKQKQQQKMCIIIVSENMQPLLHLTISLNDYQ